MGKATNFKFCTHILSIDRNKSPLQISGKVAGCVVRTLKNFQGTHILGASRGLLCDSSDVLSIITSRFYSTIRQIGLNRVDFLEFRCINIFYFLCCVHIRVGQQIVAPAPGNGENLSASCRPGDILSTSPITIVASVNKPLEQVSVASLSCLYCLSAVLLIVTVTGLLSANK